jgi:hypothetical protein
LPGEGNFSGKKLFFVKLSKDKAVSYQYSAIATTALKYEVKICSWLYKAVNQT